MDDLFLKASFDMVNEKEQEVPVPLPAHAQIKSQLRILTVSGKKAARILASAEGQFIDRPRLKVRGRAGLGMDLVLIS